MGKKWDHKMVRKKIRATFLKQQTNEQQKTTTFSDNVEPEKREPEKYGI